jgi:hypothetical protein
MGPIAAFDEHVGEEGGDQLTRSFLVEQRDGVDGVQSESQGGAVRLRNQGTAGTFDGAHAGIGIESEDENVAEAASLFQEADVAGMEKVVAAVGEDDDFALALPAGSV